MENSGYSSLKPNIPGTGKSPYGLRDLPQPHTRGPETVRGLTGDVILALIPVGAWAVFSFGWRALFIVAVSVLSSVLFELLWCAVTRRRVTLSDLSAVVSGMIFGMTLPVTVPLWIPVAGAFISIIIFKQLFGGLGRNCVNPAMCARALLFPAVYLLSEVTPAGYRFDSIAPVLPDEAIKKALEFRDMSSGYRVADFITGNTRGNIGEMSVILITAAAVFLCVRKTISWHIPVSFAGTGLALVLLSAVFGTDPGEALTAVLGAVLFAAVFSATDPVTSPVLPAGKLIYGACCGMITAALYLVFRINGVYFAIPVMNLLSKPLDDLVLKLRLKNRSNNT